MIEPRLGGQAEDALGVIGGGFVEPGTALRRRGHFFQAGPPGGKADFGEAQEDHAENGRGVFLGFEARVGGIGRSTAHRRFSSAALPVSFPVVEIQCIGFGLGGFAAVAWALPG